MSQVLKCLWFKACISAHTPSGSFAIISISIVILLSVSMTGLSKLGHRSANGVATHWAPIEVNESHL